MSKPEPSADLREDVLDHFPIPQLLQDDDLVVSELIAVVSICHNCFSFRRDSGPRLQGERERQLKNLAASSFLSLFPTSFRCEGLPRPDGGHETAASGGTGRAAHNRIAAGDLSGIG
jgi:hypothetical protein